MPHTIAPHPDDGRHRGGLVPTALGIGVGGAQRSAIAVTIIGGQSLCLLLTLLLVPVSCVLFDELEQRMVGERASAWLGRLRCHRWTVPYRGTTR